MFSEKVSRFTGEIPRLRRRDLRRARLTQRKFAAAAGYLEPHLSLVLSGKRPASPRLVRAWFEHVVRRIEVRHNAPGGGCG